MKLTSSPLWGLVLITLSTSLTLQPRHQNDEPSSALEEREALPDLAQLTDAPITPRFVDGEFSYLGKRRGGGGSGGGGGGGGGGSGGGGGGGSGGGGGGGGGGASGGGARGSSSSSSSSSGSSGSSGSTGGSGGTTGSRNTGTASSSSLSRPAYGGGAFYGGGASTAYRAGSRTPKGLLTFGLVGVAAAAFILPGIWLYSAYGYNYNSPYNFRNRSANRNESLPVVCLCQQYSACGCDENNNSTYLDDIVGDGSYGNFNKSLYNVADVNGTRKLVLNGTLPNGTDTTSSTTSGATRRVVLENAGFWVIGAIVGGMLYLL